MPSSSEPAPSNPSTGDCVEFDLTLVDVEGSGPYEITAELRSPRLDVAMHQGPTLNVVAIVATKPADANARAVLDPFQLQSIVDYLHRQQYVRETLEPELIQDQREWDPDGEPVDDDVWAWARVNSLHIEPRTLWTPDHEERVRGALSPEEIRAQAAACDQPDTRSSFSVSIRCDWDQEHAIAARFRDGLLCDLEH